MDCANDKYVADKSGGMMELIGWWLYWKGPESAVSNKISMVKLIIKATK